jgi:hypothetical protein
VCLRCILENRNGLRREPTFGAYVRGVSLSRARFLLLVHPLQVIAGRGRVYLLPHQPPTAPVSDPSPLLLALTTRLTGQHGTRELRFQAWW